MNSFSILLILIGLIVVALIARGRLLHERQYSWVYILFFFSGFPALIYQIVWQRSLFEMYGVNIESVTIVVTAFMLGLGIGSLIGGWISKQKSVPLLLVFGLVEFGIAAYGVVSLRVFHAVALRTAGHSTLMTGAVSFLLVLLPTIFMGATLPLLVEHLVRASKNVGHSVGVLYFVNTLGSAMACFVAAVYMMRKLGQSGSVQTAAIINAVIGSLVLTFYVVRRGQKIESNEQAEATEANGTAGQFRFFGALVVACLAGFVALGYEILWYRIFSFSTGSLAKSFPLMLGSYLAGIAFGSLFADWFCKSKKIAAEHQLGAIGLLVVFANVIGFLVAPLLANTIVWMNLTGGLIVVAIAAALFGATFPLIAHVSISPDDRAGSRLSYLYLSNIIGSASGSFLIGFILMDYLSIGTISVVLAMFGVAMGLGLLAAGMKPEPRRLRLAAAVCGLMAVTVVVAQPSLFAQIYEKLLYKGNWKGQKFLYTVENRSGVINVAKDGTVFGSGAYDGHFNTDVTHDSNLIIRAYALSALHPNPKEVLMIGLSSGSWAQVIAHNPAVQHLTIVEINPGYIQLIRDYPQVASLLKNPKVKIVIDDGRRWLVANPNAKFDAIVMNTTWNYRAHVSALLSEEFLQLVRKHLNPGGIHYYNTTGAAEVFKTGATVFPYAMRFVNFLAVSDSPIVIHKDEWQRVLTGYAIDGEPVFHANRPEEISSLHGILKFADRTDAETYIGFQNAERFRALFKVSRNITDDNMGTEWFH